MVDLTLYAIPAFAGLILVELALTLARGLRGYEMKDTWASLAMGAGNRVIYGHPFETIEADRKKAAVDSFFKGQADPAQVVRQYNVHYIFYGPEERALVRAPGPDLTGTLASEVAYSNPEVTLYRVLPPAYSRP